MNSKIITVVATASAFSKSRGENERMTIEMLPTCAKVLSASGEEYVVTRTSCTCPDHFYRRRTCRHMLAVQNVVANFKYWQL